MKKFIILLAFLPFFTACDDLFSPAKENVQDLTGKDDQPAFMEGVLANAYVLLPFSNGPVSDVATDDCVSNDETNGYRLMASGTWSSNNDPTSQWQSSRHVIMYLNNFLSYAQNVNWSDDERINQAFKLRLSGEAYGLRALFMYNLLRAHGGWGDDGVLYGVPIVTEPEGASTDFNVPRNTFKDCMDSLMADVNRAIELLPEDYKDVSRETDIPAQYRAIGITNPVEYNRICGVHFGGRMSARIAEAIRAMATLMAASPAFSEGSGYTWEQAADYAAVVIDHIDRGQAVADGGSVDALTGVASNGYTWYANASEIADLGAGVNPAEIIWRGGRNQDNPLETDNFPPTLYGNGRINPTQNLVDAFPMANGYPITDERSGYDLNDPYTGRDPRLTTYILVNGGTAGISNSVIITGNYGTTTNDQLNQENRYSTRTGYYMKKHLRQDVNLNPNSLNKQYHYTAYIRTTEILLDYAEAANEAYGPKGTGSHAYSAYDIIKAIRARAGVGGTNDPYLEEMANSKETMRELIRNERRLELCFENKRFYDLRRWQVPLEQLNETARGMQITQNVSTAALIYTPITVENRAFKDYMYWGPVPYSECLKFSNLQQNKGW
ncbi:putative uncharacterized protein [Prevotella sp. CAG:1320]|nr:putative uncharacterized protein [Prevotella sp. CAG:1320]